MTVILGMLWWYINAKDDVIQIQMILSEKRTFYQKNEH
jgi:hypothetical protein